MAKTKLGDLIATPAQVRILDDVRERKRIVYGTRRLPALKRLEALGYITLQVEAVPNCGRPKLLWTATLAPPR